MQKNKLIGVFGGTFDPIHFGHLRSALELYQNLPLEQVRFIPCKQPVHKQEVFASSDQRKHMVALAIENRPGFVLDARELDRESPSYMIETLLSLKTDFPDSSLCLILGADALAGFASWHRWQEIITVAHLVVVHRPEFTFRWQGELAQVLQPKVIKDPNKLMQQAADFVLFQATTALEISATEIRQGIQQGKSPRYLLPRIVLDYIVQEKIYQ